MPTPTSRPITIIKVYALTIAVVSGSRHTAAPVRDKCLNINTKILLVPCGHGCMCALGSAYLMTSGTVSHQKLRLQLTPRLLAFSGLRSDELFITVGSTRKLRLLDMSNSDSDAST